MVVQKITLVLRMGVAACVVMAGVALPRTGTADTLADALVGAYTHSGLLQQNRALLRAADEDVAAAVATLKPVLSWSASLTQTYGTVRTASSVNSFNNDSLSAAVGLAASLVLYDFGSRAFRVEAAKETVLATREALIDIEQQVLLRAVQAYMGVIEASEFVALRENNVRLLTEEQRAANDRFEVGEVTRTDVALAQAQLAQARSGLAAARGQLISATEEYRNVVGRAPGRLRQPPGLPAIEDSVDAAKAIAVRRHPSMLSAQRQVAAADLLVQATAADMKPTISLTGRLTATESLSSSDFNRGGSVGLEAGQTIYQGGALSASNRQAQARADAQRGNLHVVRHAVQQDVGNAYATLTTVQAQLAASERQVRAARIAFRGIREEATLGARTTLDVLDAEQALLDAQSLQVSARASLYFAAYSILASTGRLTAKDLQLPVQIYDPTEYYNLVKDSPAKRSKEGQKLDRVLRALQKD
ncbi:Type I secretion outer membrane protein, TolC family [Sulfitobacter noctilucicola]|uniref:Outer membrane protein n=1 Tax=Sulfitobacter noctilucicola TaxID=1342301 RepID=A0A7W6MBX5_9RHOB|nr:TolC family outer membrane protein [Sulfitobacter noctilucicola]KIN63892.1 Type I secretion outer membrane protein, TolC family [Sulfitobacter noctilucicola]MBB4175251.1 outer membrane protein [Sulfitobacter noctilucicola]